MSKKKKRSPKVIQQPVVAATPDCAEPQTFGYEEMLTELEAIVAEAEIRNTRETESA